MVLRTRTSIEYANANPLNVLLKTLELDPRTPGNRKYRAWKLVTFLAPSTVIFSFGWLTGDQVQQVANSVAGALLGVQLTGPYNRLRDRFLGAIQDARRYEVPLGEWFTLWLLRRTWVPRVGEFVHVSGNIRNGLAVRAHLVSRHLRPWKILVMQLRARMLERSWSKHYINIAGSRVDTDYSIAPAALLAISDPGKQKWWQRNRIGLRWSYWRAIRILHKIGRLLSATELLVDDPSRNGDAPVQRLAKHLSMPYTPTDR